MQQGSSGTQQVHTLSSAGWSVQEEKVFRSQPPMLKDEFCIHQDSSCSGRRLSLICKGHLLGVTEQCLREQHPEHAQAQAGSLWPLSCASASAKGAGG